MKAITLQDLTNNKEEILSIVSPLCDNNSEAIEEVIIWMEENVKYQDCEFVSTFAKIAIEHFGYDVVSNDPFLQTKKSEASENYFKNEIQNEY